MSTIWTLRFYRNKVTSSGSCVKVEKFSGKAAKDINLVSELEGMCDRNRDNLSWGLIANLEEWMEMIPDSA